MNPSEQTQLDPYKIINKLLEQNASINLQVISLQIALEEEVKKNLEGGVTNGDTEQSSSDSKKA